jgi:hypothetical protein
MNLVHHDQKATRLGAALLLTLIMSAVSLMILASVLAYSSNTARLNYRSSQYNSAVAAAEAATEKVLTQISHDYLQGGQALVNANLASYQQSAPTPSDSSYWSGWEFTDARGNSGRTFVDGTGAARYVSLSSTSNGLRGFATTYTLVSNAHQTNAPIDVTAGVLQQIQLARVPIFQFAMYASGDMEISCGQPFTITGRVHSNGQLYVEPDNLLTFQENVTAVGSILFQRHPDDCRSAPGGSVVYGGTKEAHVPALTLPIGTSNSPTAIREIIEPPPALESSSSPLGRLRYFNLADLMLVVTNTGTNTLVLGTSGNFNNFGTSIPTNELKLFVSTQNSFYDARESKTVKSIDLNIGVLAAWSATNNSLRAALGSRDLASVYVWDRRSLPGTCLSGVRVVNGQQLPSFGLTVATGSPLYVLGHFNQTNTSNLGTTNTTTTRPASLVGDAITILSANWSDANSSNVVSSRTALPTTINAALLAGAVDTVPCSYGGGMENFPRFLETWGSANVFTYNGSLVKLFPSLYATNSWGKTNVYSPPARNWSYDSNFDDPNKLPPLTPGMLKLVRSLWTTTAPNQTSVVAGN